MGTRLQRLALDEQDFRGARFLDSDRPQRGNYDILTLTQPQLVAAVHREYLEAGADVIRTNTFLANAPSQSPFGMAHVVHELNLEAARLARSIADAHEEESGRAVFVAGVVGPTDRAVSLTKGTDTADARGVSFDELVRAHADAVRGLMHGGADLILIETVFDAANARAALEAARKVFIELGYELPLAVSLTPCDDDGRIRSGETPGEVWEAIRDAPVEGIAEAIAPANFAEAKAPRIKTVLAQIIAERGEASIDFLADLPPEEGLAWLQSLPGVGPKTASLVLLFCFRKPVLPVDTHVHRVSGRIGLIGPRATAEQAHALLLRLLPRDADLLWNFHHNMLRHGQRVCVWGVPRCERCALRHLCDYYKALNAAG